MPKEKVGSGTWKVTFILPRLGESVDQGGGRCRSVLRRPAMRGEKCGNVVVTGQRLAESGDGGDSS